MWLSFDSFRLGIIEQLLLFIIVDTLVKKSNIFKYLLSISLAFVLAACASAPKTDIDPNIDFSQYRTFAWEFTSDESKRRVLDPVYDSSLFEKKLEKAVVENLFERGFTSADDPDMLFSFHLADEERRSSPLDVSVGYGRYSRHSYWNIFMPAYRSLERDQILIIVDANDGRTGELIWRGWTKTHKRSRPLSMGETYRIADKIMRGFPN